MILLLQLEASHSGGKTYRLTFRVFVPQLVWLVAFLSRLF
jgi:hypothetical protein